MIKRRFLIKLDKYHINVGNKALSISKPKFDKIDSQISFASYILSKDRIHPDPSKVKAITDFPKPTNISSLWSFLGMANQLSHFLPNLTHLTDLLSHLLKKNTAYLWLAKHNNLFKRIKLALSQSLSLQQFDPDMNTYLITDDSKLHGLSYALMQSSSSPMHPETIIQCGSRTLSKH